MLLFLSSVVPDSFDYKTCLAVGSGRILYCIRPDPTAKQVLFMQTQLQCTSLKCFKLGSVDPD